jgi:cell fate (sporulation/competence/biofilm development) regulator YlbF (YheA/YmcA/DUF963 family)
MGRKRTGKAKDVVISVRFSESEIELLQRVNSHVTKSELVRELALRCAKNEHEKIEHTAKFLEKTEQLSNIFNELNAIKRALNVTKNDKEDDMKFDTLLSDMRVMRNIVALIAFYNPAVSKKFKELYPDFFNQIAEVI